MLVGTAVNSVELLMLATVENQTRQHKTETSGEMHRDLTWGWCSCELDIESHRYTTECILPNPTSPTILRSEAAFAPDLCKRIRGSNTTVGEKEACKGLNILSGIR